MNSAEAKAKERERERGFIEREEELMQLGKVRKGEIGNFLVYFQLIMFAFVNVICYAKVILKSNGNTSEVRKRVG